MATNWPYRVDAYSVFQKILLESESTAKPSSLPVDNPTKPFWQYPGLTRDYPVDTENDPDGNKAANPLSHEGSGGSETLTNDADLVIIGSGITGVTVAYELSKKIREDESWKSKGTKFRVVIVEARDFCSGATGRNGGHLTAAYCKPYSYYASLYDAEEVKRCYFLEQHTVEALVSIIRRNGWESAIDLVEGGHSELLFSESEIQRARTDFEGTLKAGVRTEEDVVWLEPEEAKQKYGTSFPMWRCPGYNLWPLKLVTRLFLAARGERAANQGTTSNNVPEKDEAAGYFSGLKGIFTKLSLSGSSSQPQPDSNVNEAGESSSHDPFELILHTHTPVHSVSAYASSNPISHTERRWTVQTSRGDIHTTYVIYATNGYTSQLLPQLAGPNGIVPVRGQVIGVRAKVGYMDEGWEPKDGVIGMSRSGWSGNAGFEYWFPRPHPDSQDKQPSNNEREQQKEHEVEQKKDTDREDGFKEPPQSSLRKPLIIIGGGREVAADFAMYDTDDSALDPSVTETLRLWLATAFPGQFPPVTLGATNSPNHGVEMEWTGIMGYTKNTDPFVGRVKDANGVVLPGQYLCGGYTGHGMPRAYGCAEALTFLIWNDIATPDKQWIPPEWCPRHYLTESF